MNRNRRGKTVGLNSDDNIVGDNKRDEINV